MTTQKDLLTTEEFSRIMRVSVRTVHRWLRDGRVARVKVGRRWLVPAVAVDELLQRPKD